MKPQDCPEYSTCEEINRLSERELTDEQFSDGVHEVCGRCGKYKPEESEEEIDKLANDLARSQLACWLAIEHGKTRLQGDEYWEEAGELQDYLTVLGYKLIGRTDSEEESDAA